MDYYLDLYDHDREQKQAFWFDFGSYQTINYNVLASTPEFDQLIGIAESWNLFIG